MFDVPCEYAIGFVERPLSPMGEISEYGRFVLLRGGVPAITCRKFCLPGGCKVQRVDAIRKKNEEPCRLGSELRVLVPSGRTLSAETSVQTPWMSLAVWATAPVTRTPPRTKADANPIALTRRVMAFLPFLAPGCQNLHRGVNTLPHSTRL